ncbi:hypothetical protein BGX38DRAFT_1219397 [Terfezia claveryi]|nr:hypothetical protein BGX38DRAFT_1219397 [Terfezia claveryi]
MKMQLRFPGAASSIHSAFLRCPSPSPTCISSSSLRLTAQLSSFLSELPPSPMPYFFLQIVLVLAGIPPQGREAINPPFSPPTRLPTLFRAFPVHSLFFFRSWYESPTRVGMFLRS